MLKLQAQTIYAIIAGGFNLFYKPRGHCSNILEPPEKPLENLNLRIHFQILFLVSDH